MRWQLILVLMCCNSPAPAPPTPPLQGSAVAPAKPDATLATLPADFPKLGAPAATGTLAGKRFAIAKGMLRVDTSTATLDLYAWKEGDACEPQFAPGADQLYISATLRDLRVGATASGDGIIITYKKPSFEPTHETAAIVIDELGETRAKGRIALAAPDDTRVSGSFDVTVCKSPQQHADTNTLLGLAWGDKPEVSALPARPLATILLGKQAPPVTIEAVDWSDAGYAQHEIHVFLTPPKQPCAFDQMTPGFKLGFAATLASGVSARAAVTTVSHTGEPFATVMWSEPGNVVGIEGGGWFAARIDAVTATEVRGRVFGWFDDASKSMIAGAFTAKRCTTKP